MIAARPDDLQSIFRIDRFDCPSEHRASFEDRLHIIHGFFDLLPGCLYNKVAVTEENDRARVVTIVEWRDRQALEEAKAAVAEFYRRTDFNPVAFMAERGIAGEFGTYRPSGL